jgi:hypothetical protein
MTLPWEYIENPTRTAHPSCHKLTLWYPVFVSVAGGEKKLLGKLMFFEYFFRGLFHGLTLKTRTRNIPAHLGNIG